VKEGWAVRALWVSRLVLAVRMKMAQVAVVRPVEVIVVTLKWVAALSP
jgi:hypothetical protein